MSATQPASRPARATMSIGQVLAALKPDFADVSVSKIRFLESEGLIEPERTASGYRKFSRHDLDRLRTILKLQRDSYMPLKVIREHLAALDAGVTPPVTSSPVSAVPSSPGPSAEATEAAEAAAPQTPPVAARTPEDELSEPAPNVRLTESDLADEAGLEIGQVRSLRDFGVICAHDDGGSPYFNGDDLLVARIARDLLKQGLDARHLKTLRRAAEQEASLFEQLVAPAVRSRKPESRKQGAQTVRDLVRLSRSLRMAYLRSSLRDFAGGDP